MSYWVLQNALRAKAEAHLGAAVQQVSDAQRAFCSMILRQDDPERSLEDKWGDLRAHMHGEGAHQFRWDTQGSSSVDYIRTPSKLSRAV